MVVWQWVAAGAVGVALGAAGSAVIGRRRQNGAPVGEPWVLRHALAVVAVGAAGATAAFVLTYRATDGADKDRFDVAIKAATAAAALAAGLLTWGRLELSRHEHRLGVDRDLTERYGRAVDQLGSDNELVRVGGVFALERFALDAARTNGSNDVDWRMALGMLAALARKDSALAKGGDTVPAEGTENRKPVVTPTSALEAVQALGRFAQRSGRQLAFDDGPNLTGVIARRASLDGANLARASLDGANLSFANLSGAVLPRASLDGANLSFADLSGAVLPRASLDGANLSGADLSGANLEGAYLSRAELESADLSGASLSGADLTRATLVGADLEGALLIAVRYNELTVWPEGFDPPPSV